MSPKSPRVSCAAICSGWERGDVFELQKESGGHALCALCEELLGRRSCFELDAASLTAFSAVLERDYGDNPYHNSVHGADALLTTQLFMHTTSLWVCCSRLQRLATLLAAAAHDFAHPGTSNGFEEKSGSQRALRFSHDTTLERHHLASTFELLAEERTDALKTLAPSERSEVRKWTIELVLATDLSRHASFLGKLQTLRRDYRRMTPVLEENDRGGKAATVTTDDAAGGSSPSSSTRSRWRSPFLDASCADASLLCQTALKFADIGHCTKPFSLHHKWTLLIQEEFWRLGDKERARGLLPISFLCDRDKDTDIPAQQLGYFKFACKPFYSLVADLVDPNMLPLRRLNENFFEWIQLAASDQDRGPQQRRASISCGNIDTQPTNKTNTPSSPSSNSASSGGSGAASAELLQPLRSPSPLPPIQPQSPSPLPFIQRAAAAAHTPSSRDDADSLKSRRPSLLARLPVGPSYNRNRHRVVPCSTSAAAAGGSSLSKRSSSPSILSGQQAAPRRANKISAFYHYYF